MESPTTAGPRKCSFPRSLSYLLQALGAHVIDGCLGKLVPGLGSIARRGGHLGRPAHAPEEEDARQTAQNQPGPEPWHAEEDSIQIVPEFDPWPDEHEPPERNVEPQETAPFLSLRLIECGIEFPVERVDSVHPFEESLAWRGDR